MARVLLQRCSKLLTRRWCRRMNACFEDLRLCDSASYRTRVSCNERPAGASSARPEALSQPLVRASRWGAIDALSSVRKYQNKELRFDASLTKKGAELELARA